MLTERRRFGGSLDDLAAVRAGVDIPVLRKDFIVTSYQLWEARAYGADLALLIVAALDQQALVSLIERAESIGLTPLVEVHTEEELDAGGRRGRTGHRRQRAQPQDPGGGPRACSPGGAEDPRRHRQGRRVGCARAARPHRLRQAGADAVLVGESLVTGKDPRAAVADLVTAGAHPASRPEGQ